MMSLSSLTRTTPTKAQVTPEVILDFTERGTMKFAAPAVPRKDWVKDIATIKVE